MIHIEAGIVVQKTDSSERQTKERSPRRLYEVFKVCESLEVECRKLHELGA